ncbi:MAG: 2'-5' RNA ligase family protein [Chitinophagales bacterium]
MKQLYMFAIMPPPELAVRINSERLLFSEKYKCVKALKPPVHITLYPPFHDTNDFEEKIKGIQRWVEEQTGFFIELMDFNFFKKHNSPVVYIGVVKNDNLNKLHEGFLEQLKNYIPVKSSGSYTPHFTIGYRDVPSAIFPNIVKEYSTRRFSASFEVSSIYLWKHDGKNWQILNEYKFGTATQLI